MKVRTDRIPKNPLVLITILLGLLLLVIAVALFGALLWWLNDSVRPRETANRILLIETQIQAAAVFVQMLGGAFLLGTLYTAVRTMRHTQEGLEVSQEGQITERFTRAIEQLGATDENGKPRLEIRLGGVYALERIAEDSLRDYWPIMEVLTSYVREHAQVAEDLPLRDSRLRIDIQSILTVIGRRTDEQMNSRLDGLNLEEVDLRGAQLFRRSLKPSHLSNTPP